MGAAQLDGAGPGAPPGEGDVAPRGARRVRRGQRAPHPPVHQARQAREGPRGGRGGDRVGQLGRQEHQEAREQARGPAQEDREPDGAAQQDEPRRARGDGLRDVRVRGRPPRLPAHVPARLGRLPVPVELQAFPRPPPQGRPRAQAVDGALGEPELVVPRAAAAQGAVHHRGDGHHRHLLPLPHVGVVAAGARARERRRRAVRRRRRLQLDGPVVDPALLLQARVAAGGLAGLGLPVVVHGADAGAGADVVLVGGARVRQLHAEHRDEEAGALRAPPLHYQAGGVLLDAPLLRPLHQHRAHRAHRQRQHPRARPRGRRRLWLRRLPTRVVHRRRLRHHPHHDPQRRVAALCAPGALPRVALAAVLLAARLAAAPQRVLPRARVPPQHPVRAGDEHGVHDDALLGGHAAAVRRGLRDVHRVLLGGQDPVPALLPHASRVRPRARQPCHVDALVRSDAAHGLCGLAAQQHGHLPHGRDRVLAGGRRAALLVRVRVAGLVEARVAGARAADVLALRRRHDPHVRHQRAGVRQERRRPLPAVRHLRGVLRARGL
mmetsp:Transcript_26764/g.92966  ORF Transcript_26764/g.92966 Transcript_26764/m.92966 type:complete len:550 (-) Transcript_26764:1069-2718(-)